MTNFDVGETIICLAEIKDDAGAYKDPAISMKITITDKNYVAKVNNADMTKDAVGKYHYDCQTAGYIDGKYEVAYKATDGARITIQKETFILS